MAAKPAPQRTPKATEPAARRLSRLYRASSGEGLTIREAAAEWKDSDLIAFGELHGDLEGAKAQLALLKSLAAQDRPIAIAMEFFERDTQGDLDAYLQGDLDEETFRKKTRRNNAYGATHGPLVEFAKARNIPVIAANAPRRLVTGYRKSEGDYEAYLESLSEEERALLPEDTDVLEDEYREKFLKLMGMKRGPSFFRSQALWDDAMAESMVDFREEHPEYRILFIVGVFHVESGLGTITKYRNRRGKDDVRILRMLRSTDPALPHSDEEMGTADVILKVRVPKAPAARALPKGHPKTGSGAGGTS